MNEHVDRMINSMDDVSLALMYKRNVQALKDFERNAEQMRGIVNSMFLEMVKRGLNEDLG